MTRKSLIYGFFGLAVLVSIYAPNRKPKTTQEAVEMPKPAETCIWVKVSLNPVEQHRFCGELTRR